MKIADLNKEINIQVKTKTSDSMGGFVESFSTLCTIWAAIWPVAASEQIINSGQTMTISHRIRIRYMKVFDSNWRIKFGDRYFSIVSIINPNGNNEMLDLLCKEIK